MSTHIDFEDVEVTYRILKESQDTGSDINDRVREIHLFLEKADGQWEPDVAKKFSGFNRPRYTFDKCNPIVDQITGEMEAAAFSLRIRPAGGDSTKELAKLQDGLIRTIKNMSNADHIFNAAGRDMVAAGVGGWEVVHDWASNNTFDQDLLIKPINNFEDRVWFDAGSEIQTRADAKWVVMLSNLLPEEYDERFPKGGKQSVGDDQTFNAYVNKPDFITIGKIYYKEVTERTLVLMSDGSVRDKNEDFDKVVDELAAQGITVERERERDSVRVMARLFDGQAWLNKKEETVFEDLPIIPSYANFRVREGKVIYFGRIEKLIDAQRTYNYTRSRQIEEVALSPRAKYWATRQQMENDEDRESVRTLNTNADPVQFYTGDPDSPGPPLQQGAGIVNPALQLAAQNSLSDIQSSAGQFAVQQGDIDGPLSGIAIQKLQNKGDNGSIKYFKSQEIAICQTGVVLLNAIPRVYDSRRQQRILGEDGSFETITLNDQIFDEQTQKMITVNDLSKGTYDVTCDVGPAFKNRQQETVKALQELSQVIPGVAELTADIQLKNIPSPGIDMAAERVRRKLIESGSIPDSQLTGEEKQEIQAAQQAAAQNPPEEDPNTIIAKAESKRVEAETADIISKSEERANKTEIDKRKLLLQEQDQLFNQQNKADTLSMDELTLFMKHNQQQFNQQIAAIDTQVKGQNAMIDRLSQQANTLKTLREAQGVDSFTGPHATEAFVQQAEMITDQQEAIQSTPETDFVTEPVDDNQLEDDIANEFNRLDNETQPEGSTQELPQ